MNKKEKREQGIDKKTIGLQKYRRMTLNLIVILLFLSIWTTMINNIDWKFSDEKVALKEIENKEVKTFNIK